MLTLRKNERKMNRDLYEYQQNCFAYWADCLQNWLALVVHLPNWLALTVYLWNCLAFVVYLWNCLACVVFLWYCLIDCKTLPKLFSDTKPPVITCPVSRSEKLYTGNEVRTITFATAAGYTHQESDYSGIKSVVFSPPSLQLTINLLNSAVTVNMIVTDNADRQASCLFQVLVEGEKTKFTISSESLLLLYLCYMLNMNPRLSRLAKLLAKLLAKWKHIP